MTAWHYIEGQWLQGNPQIMGPMSHGSWLASTVFDGARAFSGTAPDLDLHCQRVGDSALTMGLKPLFSAAEILELCQEGLRKFPHDAELYIKPMYWAESGFVMPDADSTRFCLSLYDEPLPEPNGFAIKLSPYRRPSIEYALTNAKAACHYPNSGRALRDAIANGFQNALMLDPEGNVAELATANIWYVKDGIAHTPKPTGTFLNGITRQRIIKLLQEAGTQVYERSLNHQEFLDADEIFSTGNHGKVLPVIRLDERHLQPGPVYSKARELYWSWSHETQSY